MKVRHPAVDNKNTFNCASRTHENVFEMSLSLTIRTFNYFKFKTCCSAIYYCIGIFLETVRIMVRVSMFLDKIFESLRHLVSYSALLASFLSIYAGLLIIFLFFCSLYEFVLHFHLNIDNKCPKTIRL